MHAPRKNIAQVGDLSVDEDMAFQERSWRAQKVGQILVGLIVLAGIVGVLGGGGLVRQATADAGSGLKVEYPRFLRAHAPFEVKIDGMRPSETTGPLGVWIDSAVLKNFQIVKISPEPATQRLETGRVVLEFESAEGASPPPLQFRLEARKPGWKTGQIGVTNGAAVTMNQLVYP